MLPDILGNILELHPFGAFEVDYTLIFYDGPKMRLRRTMAGQYYLAWWTDEDENYERWIYLPVSESRLKGIMSGGITADEALNEPEDGYLFVADLDVMSGEIRKVIQTNADSLPTETLPDPDSTLYIELPEELSLLPRRDRVHVLNVRIQGAESEKTQRYGSKVVGQFLGNLQRLLDAIGQAKTGQPTARGVIPTGIQQGTQFNLLAGYTGSFGMILESEKTDDLLGESLAKDSLASLFDLMDAGSSPEDLTEQLTTLQARVAKNYGDLLGTIEASNHSVSFSWLEPTDSRPRIKKLDHEDARNILAQIEAVSTKIDRNLEIECRFNMGSVRTYRFELEDSITGDRFSGIVDELALDQLSKIPLGSHCRATLQPNLEVNSATGDERVTYTLLAIRQP